MEEKYTKPVVGLFYFWLTKNCTNESFKKITFVLATKSQIEKQQFKALFNGRMSITYTA